MSNTWPSKPVCMTDLPPLSKQPIPREFSKELYASDPPYPDACNCGTDIPGFHKLGCASWVTAQAASEGQ